jgi:predicted CoA-binding protein
MKKTVVIGASTNPERYAYLATQNLSNKGFEVVPVGLKEGRIGDVQILTGFPKVENVHTITLYVGPKNQAHWAEYIIGLKPQRVIFNPGTENEDFQQQLSNLGIAVEEACTLVLLNTGVY